VAAQTVLCTRDFQPVATPLIDLGSAEYVRMDGTATGFTGGLYDGGSNLPPAAHRQAGLERANAIQPLGPGGQPDPNGKIGMVSTGMSNAQMEFGRFLELANQHPERNPRLVIVNGALSNMTADRWNDPEFNLPWEELLNRVQQAGLTPEQVQVAWVKNTLTRGGEFPAKAQELQGHLEAISQRLKSTFPNLQITYFSSRTRSYLIERGLSPEPVAFESGYAVRWMIEKQINGDPSLNFDPSQGNVQAPYLLWGPYLWADGTNPRSDGFTWQPEDMVEDCTHPSASGIEKVAGLLMDFFTTHETAQTWFLSNSNPPQPTPTPTTQPPPANPTRTILPLIISATPPESPAAPTEEAAPAQEAGPQPTSTLHLDDIPAGPMGTSRAVLFGTLISGAVVAVIIVAALITRRK
jgi:hypothetical protein